MEKEGQWYFFSFTVYGFLSLSLSFFVLSLFPPALSSVYIIFWYFSLFFFFLPPLTLTVSYCVLFLFIPYFLFLFLHLRQFSFFLIFFPSSLSSFPIIQFPRGLVSVQITARPAKGKARRPVASRCIYGNEKQNTAVWSYTSPFNYIARYVDER